MRCVRCGVNTGYNQRQPSQQCTCGEQFAFGGRYRDPLTDRSFAAAIGQVSADGSVRWFPVHLYYEVCRRINRHRWSLRRRLPLTWEQFERLWRRWIAAHGPPPSLADDHAGMPVRPSGALSDPDVETYAFDRAVVTDSAATLRLLLANDFHVQNRCAVLPVDSSEFATVLEMLRRSDRLQVLAIHDASASGLAMAAALRDEGRWFRQQVIDGRATVHDLGLRVRHARRFRGCLLPVDDRHAALPGRTRKERRWLGRYRLELTAVRPLVLMQGLERAFNRPAGAWDDDGGFIGVGDGKGAEDDFG